MWEWGWLGTLLAGIKGKKKQPSKQVQDSSSQTTESKDQSQITTQKGDSSTQYVAEKGGTINIININGNRDKIDKELIGALNQILKSEKTDDDNDAEE